MGERCEGNGSIAEIIAAIAADQIIFERLEKRTLRDQIVALKNELAKLKG
jgi:hypothetical protein